MEFNKKVLDFFSYNNNRYYKRYLVQIVSCDVRRQIKQVTILLNRNAMSISGMTHLNTFKQKCIKIRKKALIFFFRITMIFIIKIKRKIHTICQFKTCLKEQTP